MSEANHTPGPWKPGFKADSPDADRHTVWQYVESPSGHAVATVGCYQRKRFKYKSDDVKRISQEETEANINLFAAAPDLLAACEALVAFQELTDLDDEPEDGEYGDGKRAINAARAAIAKAKGGGQ